MLGNNGLQYHFEFTHHHGHVVGKAPTQDNLLVFYLPDRKDWQAACIRMVSAGFIPVQLYNPYWDQDGRTFEDVDGYRVVLENSAWVYNNTNRNVFLAILLHAVWNVFGGLFPYWITGQGRWINFGVELFLAAIIILVYGAKTMVRMNNGEKDD